MAKEETDIVNRIMLEMSKHGIVLWKNVRGGFYPIQAIKPLLTAIFSCNWSLVKSIVKTIRPIMAGLLVEGASDLIGYKRVKITQEMVNTEICQIVAIEVKTATGQASPEQIGFTDRLRSRGGKAGLARSVEDAKKIVE